METQISEEDLLSGIEILPTTEPNTPNYAHIQNSKLENTGLSTLTDSSSASRSLHLVSPVKLSVTSKSFSDTALQVQKRLHDSLASSLQKEVEIKAQWEASPGEIRFSSAHGKQSNHNKHHKVFLDLPRSTLSGTSVVSSVNSHTDTMSSNTCTTSAVMSSLQQGPTICPSDQFPSGISPIKPCMKDGIDKSSPMHTPTKDFIQVGEDPNTKKLLHFIQQLEKDPNTNQTLADRMAELSLLLKNSSMNLGSEHVTDGVIKDNVKETQRNVLPEMNDNTTVSSKHENMLHKSTSDLVKESKQNQTNKQTMTKSSTVQSKKDKSTYNKSKDKNITSQSTKSVKTSASRHANSKSVQFAHTHKSTSEGHQPKTGMKYGKSKTAVQTKYDSGKSKDIKDEKENTAEIKPIESKPPSSAVRNMDEVRHHIQTMLNLHKIDPLVLDCSGADLSNSNQDSKGEDTFRSTDTATLLRAQPSGLFSMSPEKGVPDNLSESLTSGLFSILKTGSSKQPTSGRSSIDSSLASENGILRETLEKEIYRRKHCEKQIQKLQKKNLEIQQELAVAHSTDRKKDLMIEQLDKTLAKVVEGWKSHEANLVQSVEQLTEEKEKNKQEIVKLKEMLVNLENELAKVLEELVDEKERMLRAEEKEKAMQLNYQARTEEIAQVIDQKNEKLQLLQTKNENLTQDKDGLRQIVEELKQDIEDQNMLFLKKESEWKETVIEMEEKQKEILKKEKALTEQERQHSSEIQSALSCTEQEMARLQDLAEAQRNEMESMRTQTAVMETKQLADIRRMEAEHKIDVERQITEKLAHVYEASQQNETRIREAHKKQVLELIDSHKRELESQCHRYEDELQHRDESMRRTMAQHEADLNKKLMSKSEAMRQQMLFKMQSLLQSHYNETLQVVGNSSVVTPQRHPIGANQMQLSNFQLPSDGLFLPPVVEHSLFDLNNTRKDARTSLKESQAASPSKSLRSSLSSHAQQRPVAIKPHLTSLSNNPHKSAFVLASSLPQSNTTLTSTSAFQPVANSSNSDHFSPFQHHLLDQSQKHQLPVPVNSVAEETDAEDEGLPNLSLISSISHSTVTSVQPKDTGSLQRIHASHADVDSVKTSESYEKTMHLQINETAVESRVDDTGGVTAPSSETDLRQLQLQHYVQMLLQCSPGDPLDTALSQGALENQTEFSKNEDKENIEIKMALPMTSYPGTTPPVLMQLLNQSTEASPNTGLMRKSENIMDMSDSGTAPLNRTEPVAIQKIKQAKHNVKFAQEYLGAPPSVAQVTPVQPTVTSAAGSFLNQAQMSEISQMLGMYSTSETPTGETRLAAEQLLNYLRGNKSLSESSVQPAVTSSPMKKNWSKKHSDKVAVAQQRSLAPSSGRSKTKNIGGSPVKSHPAWR